MFRKFLLLFSILFLPLTSQAQQWNMDGITELGSIGDHLSDNNGSQLKVTPYHSDGTEGMLLTGVDYVVGNCAVQSILA